MKVQPLHDRVATRRVKAEEESAGCTIIPAPPRGHEDPLAPISAEVTDDTRDRIANGDVPAFRRR